MKLWKISQNVNNNYDTYDSGIVVAEDEAAAKQIHPEGRWEQRLYCNTWCVNPNQVRAEYIGEAASNLEAGTAVLWSFNAG